MVEFICPPLEVSLVIEIVLFVPSESWIVTLSNKEYNFEKFCNPDSNASCTVFWGTPETALSCKGQETYMRVTLQICEVLDMSGLCVIDQSHRYGRRQAVCREPAGSYDKTTRTAICFEHIPALWYFGTSITYPSWFRRVKLVVIPPRFI